MLKLSSKEHFFKSKLRLAANNLPKLYSLYKIAPTDKTKGLALAVIALSTDDKTDALEILKNARRLMIDEYDGLILCGIYEELILHEND